MFNNAYEILKNESQIINNTQWILIIKIKIEIKIE